MTALFGRLCRGLAAIWMEAVATGYQMRSMHRQIPFIRIRNDIIAAVNPRIQSGATAGHHLGKGSQQQTLALQRFFSNSPERSVGKGDGMPNNVPRIDTVSNQTGVCAL